MEVERQGPPALMGLGSEGSRRGGGLRHRPRHQLSLGRLEKPDQFVRREDPAQARGSPMEFDLEPVSDAPQFRKHPIVGPQLRHHGTSGGIFDEHALRPARRTPGRWGEPPGRLRRASPGRAGPGHGSGMFGGRPGPRTGRCRETRGRRVPSRRGRPRSSRGRPGSRRGRGRCGPARRERGRARARQRARSGPRRGAASPSGRGAGHPGQRWGRSRRRARGGPMRRSPVTRRERGRRGPRARRRSRRR